VAVYSIFTVLKKSWPVLEFTILKIVSDRVCWN